MKFSNLFEYFKPFIMNANRNENWKWKIENWKLKMIIQKSWTSIMKWWTIAWIMLLIRMQARNVLLWIERYWHKCYNIENHLWFVGDVCALLFVGWWCGWCSTARVTKLKRIECSISGCSWLYIIVCIVLMLL